MLNLPSHYICHLFKIALQISETSLNLTMDIRNCHFMFFMPFIKLSMRVFAFDMKELICVPCCSREFASFIVLRVSSLMCLPCILTSSVVAVPKRLFEIFKIAR